MDAWHEQAYQQAAKRYQEIHQKTVAQHREITERNRQISERNRHARQRRQIASSQGLSRSGSQREAERAARLNAPATSSAMPVAGWYEDPWGHAFARWWDGTQWTNQTRG
ncbi:hypothetical protein MTY59_35660 [Mycobacterium senriense]|uniref:DUF2510 domain-containing protein n=1 Tax=Mycobacterium senriense TaxID=2775496 RepID=A0ABN6IMV0_9MYCO|nr:hypothetical protein MTY59_35660 [Mycobacterium senriense]